MPASVVLRHDDVPTDDGLAALRQAAQDLLGGTSCRLTPLRLRPKVAGETQKFLVRAPSSNAQPPLGLIEWSVEAAPNKASRAARRADAARSALGPVLGEPVVVPRQLGTFDGRSATIAPFHDDWTQLPLLRRLQRRRVLRDVLAWHLEAVSRTARAATPQEAEDEFHVPLRRLAAHPAVSADVRAAATQALDDLDAGRWTPWLALWHGDFWCGNLMRPLPGARHRMAVIDWGGARRAGPGIYDTLCMADSVGMPPDVLRAELERHAAVLHCAPAHVGGHALASLGWLSRNLGEWPVARFAEKCERVLCLLRTVRT